MYSKIVKERKCDQQVSFKHRGTTYTGKVTLGLTSSHRHAGQQIGMDFFKSGYATRGQEKDEFKPRPLFVRRD